MTRPAPTAFRVEAIRRPNAPATITATLDPRAPLSPNACSTSFELPADPAATLVFLGTLGELRLDPRPFAAVATSYAADAVSRYASSIGHGPEVDAAIHRLGGGSLISSDDFVPPDGYADEAQVARDIFTASYGRVTLISLDNALLTRASAYAARQD